MKITIDIQPKYKLPKAKPCDTKDIVVPGEMISNQPDYICGINTFKRKENENDEKLRNAIYSSVVGEVCIVSKLIYVRTPNFIYKGTVGDTIVGRIIEVDKSRWKIDTNTRKTSILTLSNIKLPGGESRRRSEEDEKAMRQYLEEGDLIVAEVREIHHDNVLSLMVRDKGQGKLGQGVLKKVRASLIVPQKKHTHILPNGVTLILGCNGLVWVAPTRVTDYKFEIDESQCPLEDYQAIARIGNCVDLLARRSVPLSDASVYYAYETSIDSGYSISDLLKDEVITRIAEETEIHIGSLQ